MPLKYVKGDLFSTDIKCIAHGCNTAGVMGSGVAAVVKKKFPNTFKAYEHECMVPSDYIGIIDVAHHRASLLGKTVVFSEKNYVILNMFTQGDWSRAYGTDKRYVSYDAVQECFEAANNLIRKEQDKRLAIPMIGAGLGGGDWRVIEKIIEVSCPDIEVTVYQL